MSPKPVLRAVSPDASPDEVAAIVAAIATLSEPGPALESEPGLDEWVRQSRLRARRVGRVRGAWRMSGRVARRERP